MSDKPLCKIPFVEHEYEMYKAERKKKRIIVALVLTNVAWAVAYILSKSNEKTHRNC